MSNFGGVWISILDDAIAVGRSALRELDAREIPVPLRRVAAYSGGNLPPPLAASLLAEIDGNEWFRNKVEELWGDDPLTPGALFVKRPEGWWLDLVESAASASSTDGRDRIVELERQLAKSESKVRAVAGKLAEQRKEVEAEKRRSRDAVETVRQSLHSRFEVERAELEEAQRELARLTERLAALESEHRALQDAFANLRGRFAKSRRFRVEESTADGTVRSLPSSPVKLARLLDLQTASFGRTPGSVPAADTVVTGETGVALTLDSGVRPDSADGIRWLLKLDEPVVVLVDGYNAQFHIDRSDFTSGAARRTLVGALQRLREVSSVRHRIVAVFDSTLPGERLPRSSLAGVEVRFTEQDVIADEEIVDMAADLDRVVVISSDREVREGSEANGAVVLWSEALAEWLARL